MSFFDRDIQMPGSELLPPSRDPIFPSSLKENEKLLVRAPVAPIDEDRRYWLVRDALTQHPNDTLFAWKNDPRGEYGSGRGIERLPSPCVFQFKPKPRRQGLPDFWAGHGLFIVSTRLLDLLRRFDAEAIASKPIVMKDPEGNIFEEDHHFVDVIRCIEAVDYTNSNIIYSGSRVTSDGTRFAPYPRSYPSVRLLSDLNPSFKIFRHKHRNVFVSADVRDTILATKPTYRNIDFTLPSHGF